MARNGAQDMGSVSEDGIMNIGIDARWIFKELSGIGVYTRELVRALAAIDVENRYTLFFDSAELMERTLSETGARDARNFRTTLLPFGLFSPLNQLRMPTILRRHALDVFHSTNYMIPFSAFPANRPGRIRCVTTIHDLIPLMFPEYAPRSKKRRFFALYRILMLQVGRRSDVIITDSKCSRADVIRLLRIPPEREDRVLSIPVGVSPAFRPAVEEAGGATSDLPHPSFQTADEEAPKDSLAEAPEKRRDSQLSFSRPRPRKTILWVGRPDPYKNLTGLIEAFARARKRNFFPIQLRLAGPRDDRYPEASHAASRFDVQNDVSWLGYVPDAQLVREYQNADALVLPSRYEGFGLPIIEAMACGTPVICGTEGSMPEVAGDAAIKVHPDDTIGIAEAIVRVLSDQRLADDMRQRGLRHASNFTWRATAEKTLLAYRKALE